MSSMWLMEEGREGAPAAVRMAPHRDGSTRARVAKRADFFVKAVRYDEEGVFVEKVRVVPLFGPYLGLSYTWSRDQILDALEAGFTLVSAPPSRIDARFVEPDAELAVVSVAGDRFIKSLADEVHRDHLGELPTF